MLSQPKLVKNESAVQKQLALKKEGKSSARFLMGLNNRVAKLDKRLDRLEANLSQTLKQSIGYKELGLTFALAVLIFTSTVLAIRETAPNSPSLESLISGQPNSDKNKAILNVLKTFIDHNESNTDSAVSRKIGIASTPYSWPLEKQSSSQNIQYSQHKHGIQITAQLGDPIISIANGKVVYSGNAIPSYGNLILIQHANDVISVYGNNYTNYVNEGDRVVKGHLIAAAGEANSSTAKLYFEIRYKGQAEDPFLYYP